jgi:hypothetical protein
MSNKYKDGDTVPDSVLADRLDELAQAVIDRNMSEFVMRIPAELDYCPDLVMHAAAMRLRQIQADEANG